MARIAYGRNKTQVDLSAYPDNSSYPIGTAEWNEDPEDQGMFGFTKRALTIASDSFNPTATYIELTGQTTTDDIDSIGVTDTNAYDLIYLTSASGQTLTLKHQNNSGNAGEVVLLGGADKTLSTTVPTLLIRDDTSGVAKWYEWGGGASNLSTLTVDSHKDWLGYSIGSAFLQPVSLTTSNTLSSGEHYAIKKIDISGSGSLTVTGSASVGVIE